MNLHNLIGQLSASKNPMDMLFSLVPNQRGVLSNLANANTDEQRAEILADLCNKNGITKEQLQQALRNKGF